MKLQELASVLRSKNAGPFRTTLDIFFDSEEPYKRVKNSGVLTKEYVASLYGLSLEDVIGIFHVDGARGIKITIAKFKGIAGGDLQCRDVYGGQQHVLLLDIEIP